MWVHTRQLVRRVHANSYARILQYSLGFCERTLFLNTYYLLWLKPKPFKIIKSGAGLVMSLIIQITWLGLVS